MPFSNAGGPTLIVILVVIILLFGAPKLPGLARSIGQSLKIFRNEVGGDKKSDARPEDHDAHSSTPATSSTPAPSEPAPAAQNTTAHNAPNQNTSTQDASTQNATPAQDAHVTSHGSDSQRSS